MGNLAGNGGRSRGLVVLGLVLVGLLSGILGTLWAVRSAQTEWIRPTFVERVQLGNSGENPNRSPGPIDESSPVGIDRLNTAFKDVAFRVTPSVVYIEVESIQVGDDLNRGPRGGGATRSVGSGVIIGEQGFIVTNNHVIDGARRISVTLSDKREYAAELIGTDPDTDLAVLRLPSGGVYQAVALGRAGDVQVGEWVLAIGNPFRLTSTVTAGIISALGRQVNVIDDRFGIENFIQTDAAINPGNSGGALVNLKGELIGIATAIATETGTYEGYGFAVPVDLMERVVRDLIQFGEVERGFLGVSIDAIDAARARELGLSNIEGVYLRTVQKGLAASKAGLAPGDVLLAINGKAVSAPNELQSAIALYRPGEVVSIDIWRDGSVEPISVQLSGKDSPEYESWASNVSEFSGDQGNMDRGIVPPELEIVNLDSWGVGLANLSDRYKNRFDVDHGVYIAFVVDDGVFSLARIPRNVLLMEINGARIETIDDVDRILDENREAGEPAMVTVRRYDGVKMFFEIAWDNE